MGALPDRSKELRLGGEPRPGVCSKRLRLLGIGRFLMSLGRGLGVRAALEHAVLYPVAQRSGGVSPNGAGRAGGKGLALELGAGTTTRTRGAMRTSEEALKQGTCAVPSRESWTSSPSRGHGPASGAFNRGALRKTRSSRAVVFTRDGRRVVPGA